MRSESRGFTDGTLSSAGARIRTSVVSSPSGGRLGVRRSLKAAD